MKARIEAEKIKRCYIGSIKRECPNCHNEMTTDKNDYLSYPENKSLHDLWFTCDYCDSEYSLEIKFSNEIKLEATGELIKE